MVVDRQRNLFDLVDLQHFAISIAGTDGLFGDLGATLPRGSLLGAPEFLEDGGAGREQAGTPRERAVRVEFGDVELLQGALRLAEVQPCARHRDRELHADLGRQGAPVDGATDLEGAVGTTDPPLAVDEQCDLVVAAGDPAIGAQFAHGKGEVPERVRGDRDGLTDDRDASGAAGCRERVLVRELRVVVDEACGHREMTGDLLGVLLAEGLQFIARSPVEILRRHVGGQRRCRRTDTTVGILRRPARPAVPIALGVRFLVAVALCVRFLVAVALCVRLLVTVTLGVRLLLTVAPRQLLPFAAPRASFLGHCCFLSHACLTRNGHPSLGGHFTKEVRRCPTLPQGPPCSTIGAVRLSFRVRNVTGRFPHAMAAETLLMFQSAQHVNVVRFSTVHREPLSGRKHLKRCVIKSSAY